MGIKLDGKRNPYSEENPFSVLGVDHGANSNELRQIHDDMLEDINYMDYSDEVRVQKREKIKEAYNAMKKPVDRAKLSVFVFDNTIGEEQCKITAKNHQVVNFEFSRILGQANEIVPEKPDIKDGKKYFNKPGTSKTIQVKITKDKLKIGTDKETLKFITFER